MIELQDAAAAAAAAHSFTSDRGDLFGEQRTNTFSDILFVYLGHSYCPFTFFSSCDVAE